ncbi:CRISPR-associated protein Cas4 [Pyrococcus abyssi]|uniref:CRISPR-associated exonuclease Cas4 n=1 Tax=Pyrococcus abyssi (strain GE5 / Orsay) TaxID=272844 RepID=Q9V1W6_PYRAB|nr:CRISPR-associated protein Cas4 [Pyrococcus abyssi]CAB49232.1 Hypothetical protein PAB2143 [Pyrococcus abyssi GE5]CCE69687.1 TPA: hypothetical protein PAB2143 [Pyrococcus abyssi GE5]
MIKFYASEALICPRRVWFRIKGFPEMWPEVAKPRLEKGVEIHEILGKFLLEKFNVELEKSVILRLPKLKMEIHGRIDAYKDVPIEIKGKSYMPKVPIEYHLAQLNLYLRGVEADYGYLYYIKLGGDPWKIINGLEVDEFPYIRGQNVKVFEVPYDVELFKETIKYFYEIKLFLEEDKLPPAWRGPHCNFCPYKYLCQNTL